ncbi:MAG TPA: hypothetical protein VII95_05835 [Terriglobales bacterium]|jgi:hypothetical protein
MKVSDYFAELFVAGRVADAGWNVYFPHRDQGFDFIIMKRVPSGELLIRPVQVKGKYPTEDKGDQQLYGYVGKLELHPEMVLAIPFFSKSAEQIPAFTAHMPMKTIKPHQSRGYRCQPVRFKDGEPQIRGDHRMFFDEEGMRNLESPLFRDLQVHASAAGEDV